MKSGYARPMKPDVSFEYESYSWCGHRCYIPHERIVMVLLIAKRLPAKSGRTCDLIENQWVTGVDSEKDVQGKLGERGSDDLPRRSWGAGYACCCVDFRKLFYGQRNGFAISFGDVLKDLDCFFISALRNEILRRLLEVENDESQYEHEKRE